MAKTHRGKGIRAIESHARGTCPICKTTRIKLLYEATVDGKEVKVCKFCHAKSKNEARLAPPAPAPVEETENKEAE